MIAVGCGDGGPIAAWTVPGKPDNTTVALHMQNSCEFIFVVPQRGVRTNPSNTSPLPTPLYKVLQLHKIEKK